jgi:hypothetical protein
MATKPKKHIFTTPKGIAVFPWLSKPDTKFNPDGEYKVNLRLSEESAADLRAKLESILDDYWNEFIETIKPPLRKQWKKVDVLDEVLDDEGDYTGDVLMKFKLRAVVRPKGKDSFSQRPIGYDAGSPPKELAKDVSVFGGSVIKVNFQAVPYDLASSKTVGLSFRLLKFQVIELSSGSGGAAPSEFSAEEGGYVSTAKSSKQPESQEFDDSEEEDDEF